MILSYYDMILSYYNCIIDVGKIGPKYQMGHSHADTLNFDIFSKNKNIIQNFGISMEFPFFKDCTFPFKNTKPLP